MTNPLDPHGPPQPYVVITLKEVYDAVLLLVGKFERMATDHDGVKADLQDHEARIRVIESRRWPLPTLIALLAAGSLIVAIIALVWRR